MWHCADSRFCVRNDTLVIHQKIGGQSIFTWPVGADVDGMIDELLIYARENHLPMRFYPIGEKILEGIRMDKRLQPVMATYDRRWSDYIYSFEEAKEFKGRKFSGQRNHINKFKRLYGEPEIRFLTPEDMPKLNVMMEKYEAEHSGGKKMERLELEHTRQIIDTYTEFGLYAACMIMDDEIAAFSIGEVVGDMLLIHVEKALTRYSGIYPVMYNGFVNLVAKHHPKPLTIINREDDSGDPGLRTSKQQYQPIGMVDKYIVNTNSPAGKADKCPVVFGDNIVLTEIRESDKAAFLRLNTDVENNRFWGYDYREDASIVGDIDENTFYDSVQYDMLVGDSVNLAIRTSENGEMIGECVIWNFTHDGTAEIGCRLLPEEQGKGYGKAAFGAVAGYAREKLGVKVWARCHVENEASRRMIAGNNFKEVAKDGKVYLFEMIH